jgi:hypothetical protein
VPRAARAAAVRAVTFPERSGRSVGGVGGMQGSGRQGARRGAWLMVLGVLAGGSLAAMVPLSVLAHQVGDGVVALVVGVPCAGVGLVVARRQPANPLGWLFLVIAICLFLSTVGGDYAILGYRLGHHVPFGAAGLALDPLWAAALALFVVVILLFPDGSLPSRLWRWALRVFCLLYAVLLVALAVATAGALAAHPVRVDATGGLVAVDDPVGWFAVFEHSSLLLILLLSLAFIGHQALSWRRSSGERRQQLKWLASGAAVAIVSLVIAVPFSTSGNTTAVREWVDNLAWFGLAALPVSMGVAILKHRLYEIDRIISRTLAYAVVTGMLVGVYSGLVLLATQVLAVTTPVSVAAATLASAALFSPLRRRVQRTVDRRFNRARYDAEVMVAAFALRLKDAVELNSVRDDLADVVHKALEPMHVSVWTSERD